ncbi:MAG: Phosphate-import permease protein PhnE [Dehalococcoidia bacterium]|nr:Phosphate-import permease protein PhnE [Bacillota bacterium]MBT9139900.1 Phosphate-import permease protein PhnE [Bacillota bacterium]
MGFLRKKGLTGFILLGLVLLWGAIDIGLHPMIFAEGIPHTFRLFLEMFPPDFGDEWTRYPFLMVETIQIGLAGTFGAIILSIFLGMMAARNITPCGILYILSRFILDFFRTMSDVMLALIFIIAVGFGPLPAVLAISLSSAGFLGKSYADAIEAIDPGPVEALRSTGANRLQIVLFGILPQVWPASVALNLFIADRNIRMAAVLGIVGAGGIGGALMMNLRLFRYPEAAAIILIIFATIWLLGWLSTYLRKKII